MKKKIQVSPSILSANFGDLNKEVASVEKVSDRLHIDVMDGHFVPNISFGAPVMRCVKTKLPMDVHLMIDNPQDYLKDFAEAGADTLIVHYEACKRLGMVIKKISDLGCKVGVSIKPKTKVEVLKHVLPQLDQILVMTVEPGFSGQSFMEDMVPKVKALREMGYKGDIAVDGGVNDETGAMCREAGANILVAASYIFKAKDRKKAIKNLRG